MAFALVHFYQEDMWDIIPYSDIILDDEHEESDAIEGIKTLVLWREMKGKGKGNSSKVPAEIIKISGW